MRKNHGVVIQIREKIPLDIVVEEFNDEQFQPNQKDERLGTETDLRNEPSEKNSQYGSVDEVVGQLHSGNWIILDLPRYDRNSDDDYEERKYPYWLIAA